MLAIGRRAEHVRQIDRAGIGRDRREALGDFHVAQARGLPKMLLDELAQRRRQRFDVALHAGLS